MSITDYVPLDIHDGATDRMSKTANTFILYHGLQQQENG